MLAGSAFKNKGVQALSTPSSTTCRARSTSRRCRGSIEEGRGGDPAGRSRRRVLALAFKVMTDPHVGKLTYFRVFGPGQGR